MSIQTVEISLPESIIKVVEIRQGPAGPGGGGTNSVTSATTSDGTANLYLDSIRFEATNGGPTQLGEMAWESTDGSIDAMLESGVIVAMGEDLVIRVRNTTASPITKGTALTYDGTSGASGRIEVKPWVGANIPTAKLFLGFAACDMPANSNGYSQWFGKLAEINTSGGAQTWLDEQIIYAVPGASATITNVAPTSGEYAAAAVVINAGSGTSGILFVRPTFEVASSTSATANTLVLRDGSGGASFAALTLSGTGGSPFTSTLTGGVNFANRTLVLPDVSGTLVTAGTLANSATITASTAVAVNTIVLRDSVGVINITSSNVTGGTNYASTAAWTYAGSSASAHRIALGAGTTGAELFGAADLTDARATLQRRVFVKPTDSTKNNDAVIAADSYFASIPVDAGVYRIYIELTLTTNTTAQGAVRLSHPANARPANYISNIFFGSTSAGVTQTATGSTTTLSAYFVNGTRAMHGYLDFTFGASGTLSVEWAQSTATAVDTILRAGSYLIIERLS